MKNACNKGNWTDWPDPIHEAMEETVATYCRRDVIQVKAKVGGAARARQYDTLQVTPNTCTCRVYFGGDGHHQVLQTGSSATTATSTMCNMLMARFKPRTERWDENQPGYHKKAFHLVLNKYHRNDGIDPRPDRSETYHGRNPITSLSFGRGAILAITNSNKRKSS